VQCAVAGGDEAEPEERPARRGEAADAAAGRYGPEDFPGCESFHLPERALKSYEGRIEFWDGLTETETWLALPGASHFTLKSDERPDRDEAPRGLALLWAGLAFCFMTQLDRYIEHMKFAIDGVRLVQHCPDAADIAAGRPVDTHLFLNGREELETYETLMRIAARTCYLHATLAASLEPRVSVLHRETAIR